MNVATILNDKGRSIATVAHDATMVEAARLLQQHNVGALVVLGERSELVGILSERDIVRMIGKSGADCLNQPVSQFMSADVFTCAPSDTVNTLMSQMTERRVRHLPVVDDGKLAGIVSIGDVVKWRIVEAESRAQALREYIATG
jgi:CBS domain-containing protein